ncbi:phosphomannomutase/phosphoglucomutase [Luteimonas vadosa]|uniref:phosphomannomutase n=1 Tax=Luteimonas vadosa TaxID=1165507 RepID=A0ABP9DRM9_9GAMM
MTEQDTSNPRQWMAQIRPALPILAVVAALLSVWMAWSGWSQMQGEARRSSLEQNRDSIAAMTSKTLQKELDHLERELASAPVQSALAAGNLAAASAALGRGWRQAEEVVVLPTDLAAAYAGLPAAGFGRIAVAESALASRSAVSWVIRDAGAPKLAIAAPARAGGEIVGVALARLPIARATAGIDAVSLDERTFLALRQGGFTIAERGNAALAEVAERRAIPVPGTGLRVAAAMPTPVAAPFSLDAIPLFGISALLLVLAFLLWRAPRTARAPAEGVGETAASPTLQQSVIETPPEAAPVAHKVVVPQAPAPAPVRIDRGIFRAYDIRGIVGQTLDRGVAELVGHAIGSLMADKGLNDIVVGRDGRLSGPEMAAGLIQGLRKAGRNVVDIGMAPTPLVYFGAYFLRAGCCVSVTGSHNPPDYNGFKVVVGGETLSGDAIVDLHARIAEDRLHTADEPGSLSVRDIADDYVERIASDVQIDRRLKVVVDAGNGAAGEIAPRVLAAIGADVEPLYCEVDGTFPNHHPDPSDPANLQDLINMVTRFDADLGIAFDGDGDRLGVVTRTGENIFADRLLMLFAADVLERNPGAVILYDVKCTGRLPGHILRHGGSPLMWKTGHSLIKAKMRETGAELAGEMSGHFFFGERWYGFDDGIYAAARLLEILAGRPESPGEVLEALPNGVSTPELKVEAPNGDPHAFVKRFVERARFEDGARPSTIDGMRVDWSDGWGLVRASNTTPVLVMRFDADSEEALARIQDEFRGQMLALDPGLKLPF